MSTGDPDLLLARLSWPEVRDLQDQVELVLIPIGSNEQHGPNLSVDFDIAHSAAFCRRVSQRMYPRVLVAPAIPWGVSFHHMNFPGTITLSPELFMQLLVEVVGSLHAHGFERFLIVNGHGGNVQSMGVAAVMIQEQLDPLFIGACSVFSFQDRAAAKAQYEITDNTGHACEFETSVGMYLIPETVKTGALAAGELTDLTHGFRKTMAKYGVSVPYRFDEFTTNGALGDARLSSVEIGRVLTESGLDNICAFIEELIEVTPRQAVAD